MPVSGAILDQPLEMMISMETCKNVYDIFTSYQNKTGSTAEWGEAHPTFEDVYLSVLELREDG